MAYRLGRGAAGVECIALVKVPPRIPPHGGAALDIGPGCRAGCPVPGAMC